MLKTRGHCEKGSSLCFRVPFHLKMGLKIEKAQFTKRGREIVVGNIWMDTDLAVGDMNHFVTLKGVLLLKWSSIKRAK